MRTLGEARRCLKVAGLAGRCLFLPWLRAPAATAPACLSGCCFMPEAAGELPDGLMQRLPVPTGLRRMSFHIHG
jgi:hypothetical protein